MDEEVNPLERDHFLSVVLPSGLEKNATVHGSKPVMDLLVTLCASYHLNPSDYTVEVLSPNKNNISFKPNSPIGSLEAEKIVLKPKGAEEKIRRPYMPEATVRLLINYNRAHKAVVRVNPRVPLELLLPAVCDKCEFKVESTVLLRDSQSTEPLDLRKTLNEHGLREVFARDTAERDQHRPETPETEIISPPHADKEMRQKENAGFLSLFRKKKKKPELDAALSAPASPAPNKQTTFGESSQDVSSSNALPMDTPKKRRAPQPPMGASLSVPSNLSTCHDQAPQTSADSTLRRTKRRAPPPPCANSHQEQQLDTQVTGPDSGSNPEEEQRESDVSLNPSSSSSRTCPASSPSPSSRSSRPPFSSCPPSFRGKDFSDARDALAKVLTSSVSKGTLINRVRRGSATIPKLHCSSFSTPRGSDPSAFCSERQSVLKSKFHTEPEWADPLQRKGLTTFKVVPSNKHKPQEPDPALEGPDQTQVTIEISPESEAPPGAESRQSVPEEDSCSPHGSETGSCSSEPEPGLDDPDQTHVTIATNPETEAPSDADYKQSEPEEDPNSDGSESLANSYEPETCPDDPDHTQVTIATNPETEAPPEAEYKQSEPEEDPYSPHGSETGSSSCEAEPGLDVTDQNQVTLETSPGSVTPPEAENSQCDPEEDSPHGSESGSALLSQQTSVQEASDSPPSPCESNQQEPPVSPPPVRGHDGGPTEEADEVNADARMNTDNEREDLHGVGRPSVSGDQRRSCPHETGAEEDEEDMFPPPPPPVFFPEDEDLMEAEPEETASPPGLGPVTSESPTEPQDHVSSAPSRFAQAVALAVQRSRLQGQAKVPRPQSPRDPGGSIPSGARSTYQHGA